MTKQPVKVLVEPIIKNKEQAETEAAYANKALEKILAKQKIRIKGLV